MTTTVEPGTKWSKKSNARHVAIVLWVEGNYVRFFAPWSTLACGEMGKAEDAFLAHYRLLPPTSPESHSPLRYVIWSRKTVAMFKALQEGKINAHPYTCPNRSDGHHHHNGRDLGCLVATRHGWVCPDCDYTQNWAHPF